MTGRHTVCALIGCRANKKRLNAPQRPSPAGSDAWSTRAQVKSRSNSDCERELGEQEGNIDKIIEIYKAVFF